jgi:anti-sigma B factor antagonist
MHEAEIGAPQLTVEVSSPTARVMVFAVTGEIDLATSPALRDRLLSDRPWSGRGAIVDLTRVTFLGSAGIMTLLDVHDRAVREGKELVLVVPGPVVARTLEIAGVAAAFTIRTTLTDALTVFD